MTIKLFSLRKRPADGAELQAADKVRWALRQRLCEQWRQLSGDLFDAVDDFLFAAGQKGQFGDDGSYLQSMREIRSKREQFEQIFMSALDNSLQSDWQSGPDGNPAAPSRRDTSSQDGAFDEIELNLALQAMQRKAMKNYATLIRQLDQFIEEGKLQPSVVPLRRDVLVRNVIDAFESSHGVFSLPLEIRLIFLKLFEQHLLLKMDKLYQDVISVLTNVGDEVFVKRLYAAAVALQRRQDGGAADKPDIPASPESDTGKDRAVTHRKAAKSEVRFPAQEPDETRKSAAVAIKKTAVEPVSSTRAATSEAAISAAGKSIISDRDLNELVSLLSGESPVGPAADKVTGKDSMTHFLARVDSLVDGTVLGYSVDNLEQVCLLFKSPTVENSYVLKNRQGKAVFTRSRIGLAVSLRSGELRCIEGIDKPEAREATVLNTPTGAPFGFTLQ